MEAQAKARWLVGRLVSKGRWGMVERWQEVLVFSVMPRWTPNPADWSSFLLLLPPGTPCWTGRLFDPWPWKKGPPPPAFCPQENNRCGQFLAHCMNVTCMLLQPCVRECGDLEMARLLRRVLLSPCPPLLLSQESDLGSWLCPAPH